MTIDLEFCDTLVFIIILVNIGNKYSQSDYFQVTSDGVPLEEGAQGGRALYTCTQYNRF